MSPPQCLPWLQPLLLLLFLLSSYLSSSAAHEISDAPAGDTPTGEIPADADAVVAFGRFFAAVSTTGGYADAAASVRNTTESVLEKDSTWTWPDGWRHRRRSLGARQYYVVDAKTAKGGRVLDQGEPNRGAALATLSCTSTLSPSFPRDSPLSLVRQNRPWRALLRAGDSLHSHGRARSCP
mmetsp:Transcript_35265/g.81660  ORF Transcript_35265/g.81660 Transcript_35265/m.81660 type:complete len:181 (-) Transcript_35265:1069-1611(-)